LNKFTQTG